MQFVLALSPDSKEPIYVQVYESLRQAIMEGRLRFGEKLPSTRELADGSGISRFTVLRSYELLTSQGFIETIVGSGTFVMQKIPEVAQNVVPAGFDTASLSVFAQRLLHPEIEAVDAELFDELNYGAPSVDDLPLKPWREVINKCARFQDKTLFQYVSDPMGYSHLREAISAYLIRTRSVKSTPENMAIFSGAQSALDLVCRLLLDPGDCVAVENPGSPFARRTLKMHGANILPARVDSEGLVVKDLERRQEKIKLVYITPSHQDPTGVIMSMPRRLELLSWAQRTGAFIVEDDYDNEYNYYGEKPVPALHGMDDQGVVIYLSSFWKVLFPIVRIGFIVLPPQLIEPVRKAKGSIERDLPLLEHVALTEFINQGMLERQIKRLRNLYARRRAALSHVLTRRFKDHATMPGVSAGMHMIINFDERFTAEDIAASAQTAKLPMVGTENYYMDEPRSHQYMIDFAHNTEADLTVMIEEFADLLTRTLSPRRSSTLPT